MRVFGTAPSLDEIAAIGEATLARMPTELRQAMAGVTLMVQDFPEDAVLQDMGLDSPFELLGLYTGVDIVRRGDGFTAEDIDRIFLYRQPILAYWAEGEETLEHLVRHVVIHEIGHHFGFSDADMHALEEAAG